MVMQWGPTDAKPNPLRSGAVPPRVLVPHRPLLHARRSAGDLLLFALVGAGVIVFCLFCLIVGEALS